MHARYDLPVSLSAIPAPQTVRLDITDTVDVPGPIEINAAVFVPAVM
jgi:hypothetical protein